MEKWQLIELILTSIVSLITLGGVLRGIAGKIREKKILRTILDDISREGHTKEGATQFKFYVKPTIKDLFSPKKYSIRQLKKQLKPTMYNKVFFLFGDPGSGKTALMEHLAYWFCLYNRKNPNREGLEAWGIVYVRMRDINDIEDDLFKKVIDKKEIKALFLDGLDEYAVLHGKSERDVMKDLYLALFGNNDILKENGTHRKIYISSRKEPFYNMPEDYIKSHASEYKPKALEICPFNRKQILSLYKRKAGGNKGGRHLVRMRKFLDNEENIEKSEEIQRSFFRIPLFVEYADIILESPIIEKKSPMIGEAIDIIVTDWLEKEYERWYHSSGANVIGDFEPKLNLYLEKAWKLIDNVALFMCNENVMKFKFQQLEKADFDYNKEYILKETAFGVTTRQLIHRINDTEYEFVHSLFRDFFIAHLLFVNKDAAYAKKRNMLKENKNIREFYAFWIWKSQTDTEYQNESWLPSLNDLQKILPNYQMVGDKQAKDIFLRQTCKLLLKTKMQLSEQINMTINNILWLFPEVREIRWKKYRLSLPEINNLMEEGRFKLTDNALADVSDLEYFFPVKDLDISGNMGITEINVLEKNQDMTRLCLYGNPIESFLPLKEIRISRLEVEISDVNVLEELFTLPRWECCFIKMPYTANLYVKLYELHKERPCSYLASDLKIKEFKEVLIKEDLRKRAEFFEAVFYLLKDSIPTEEPFDMVYSAIEFGIEFGICIYRMGEYEKALRKFEELGKFLSEQEMADNLQKIRITAWKGCILARLEKYEEAMQYLDEKEYQELDSKEEKKVFWYWSMKCKYRGENWEWRLQQFSQEDIRLREKLFENTEICHLLFALGMALDKNGEHNGAVEVLNESYNKYHNCEKAEKISTLNRQFWLGRALYHARKYIEAENVLRECYEHECKNKEKSLKDKLETQQWLGKTLYKEGKFMEAKNEMSMCDEKQKEALVEDDEDNVKIEVTLYWLEKIEEQISKIQREKI